MWFGMTFVLLAALLLFTAYMLFDMVCGREGGILKNLHKPDEGVSQWEEHADRINSETEWLKAQEAEDVEIVSRDGLRLRAKFLAAKNRKRAILCAHGYHGSAYGDFCMAARYLLESGSSLLLIDERAQGASEGRYITFGVKERFDVCDWADWLVQKVGPETPVYLDGISMGATTVLMASGLPLPASVRGVIADCGYTDPQAILVHVSRTMLHKSAPWIFPLMDIVARFCGGFSLKDASATSGCAGTTLPVLFVHGAADDFVPPEMTLINYEACRTHKDLLIAEGARHGMSWLYETDAYKAKLDALFQYAETNESIATAGDM